MAIRYYSILRPVSMGTFPEPSDNHILEIHNFDESRFVDEIGRKAWGFISYEKPLTDKEAAQYELVCKNMENKDLICKYMCEALQLTHMFSALLALEYDAEKEIITAFFPDHTTTINVAADSGIAMITDIVNWLKIKEG